MPPEPLPDGGSLPRRAQLAARIDHTLLRPEASRAEVTQAASLAVEWGCATVCVQPEHVAHVAAVVGGRVPVCTVVAFPHGATLSSVKAHEAAAVVAHGASEVDVVAALGAIADDDLAAVRDDVAAVRAAVPEVVLKVIVESALWSPPVLRAVTEAVVDAGADYVKTSTGYHAGGGATPAAVATMREAMGTRARIKAAGGLRSVADCVAVLDAGADRLGLSATGAVLDELGPR